MKRIALVVFSWIALMSLTVQAASFDCGKAQSKVEKLICGNPRLSALDEELNKSYQNTLDKSRLDDDDEIVSAQKQWLKLTRNKCIDEQCLSEAYSLRIKVIKEVYQFFGAYQGFSRACDGSILVFTPETIGLDECRGVPYEVIESDTNHVALKPKLTSKCNIPIIKISIEKPASGLSIFGGYIVEWNQGRCNYGPVDFSMSEDQTVIFMSSKIGEERADALHKINLQGRPDRQKYNEIGLRDLSSKVRDKAAFFYYTELYKLTPILLKVITSDSDSQVRFSAAMNLSCQFSCNGAEYSPKDILALERNLPLLKLALKGENTGQKMLEIIDSVWCDMSRDSQKTVAKFLESDLSIKQKYGDTEIFNDNLGGQAKAVLKNHLDQPCSLRTP